MAYLIARTSDDYAALLLALLPPGRAHTAEDQGLSEALAGFGVEWARVEGRLLDLIEELDPTTATELLDAWERNFGLPDSCDPSPPVTDADRRDALKARLIARNGSQPAIIREVINAAGYDGLGIEIQIANLFRVDTSRVDERLYDNGWANVWWIWAASTPPQGWTRLECLFSTGDKPLKPSHSTVFFIDGLRANEVTYPV
jgi:uncharacterized protein YmfQ (DUF2313 family)